MHKVQLDIRPKHVIFVLVALVAIACGSIASITLALRSGLHLHIDLSGLAAVGDSASAIGSLTKPRLPPCSTTIRRLPAGDPKQEATMVYLAGIIDLYRTTFGRLPDNITDLNKLPTFENADRLNTDKMKRNCSIHQMLSNRAYVLTCRGKLPSAQRLDSVLGKTVDKQFAIVDGVEVLHVPLSGACA